MFTSQTCASGVARPLHGDAYRLDAWPQVRATINGSQTVND